MSLQAPANSCREEAILAVGGGREAFKTSAQGVGTPRGHESRDRTTVLRDLDLFAVGDAVQKGEELGFRLRRGRLGCHMVIIVVIGPSAPVERQIQGSGRPTGR